MKVVAIISAHNFIFSRTTLPLIILFHQLPYVKWLSLSLSLSTLFLLCHKRIEMVIKYNPKGLITLGLCRFYLTNIHHKYGSMHLQTMMVT